MSVLAPLFEIETIAVIAIVIAAFAAGRAAGRRPALEAVSPERELMRRRRREEPAALLLVHARCDRSRREAVANCLRLTDTVESWTRRGRIHVRAILDQENLDREAVEARLAEAGAGCELQVGWAAFPDDGFTVRVLEDTARARLASIGVTERARPLTQLDPALERTAS